MAGLSTDVERAVAALDKGSLVVLPTDTVYGIGGRLDRPGTVAAIFQAKGRPEDRPLPVLAASLDDLRPVVHFDAVAQSLAGEFWPGPLTLVLPRAPSFATRLGPASDTVGVRVPAHRLAQEILRRSGPIAVTSANRSGEPDAVTVDQAREALGDSVQVYVDGGPAQGRPSTVVTVGASGVEILRSGALEAERIYGAVKP